MARLIGRLMVLLPLTCFAATEPASAPVYYKADPAKLAQLEAQRCDNLAKESTVIRRRMAGYNRPYDLEKLKLRLPLVEADYARYCNRQSALAPAGR